ncbi:MAG: hypothetical protein AW11_00100 [Candidatus Accumulibacter regalis]|uniref:Transmembrane protein n=1 Tax=Accumulibacter regalis TaxID=522306 RepID=A0A011RJD6_ACCRE
MKTPQQTIGPLEGATPPTLTPAGMRARQRKGRLTLLAVVAVCVLPLLAALYFRFVSPPEAAAMVGQPLAEPVQLPFEMLQRWDGAVIEHPEVSGRWLAIFAAPGACDERCQHTLYLTRQARTAQGRNMARLERLWLITDGTAPATELLAAHPDLVLVKASDEKVLALLGGADARKINLVDRRGFLVFRYPDDAEPKGFIRELGKLIKF